MAPDPRATDARRRLRRLARQGRRPPAALFIPVLSAVAAQIEALDVQEFLTNPTKLSKNLDALYQVTGTDGIVTVAANHEVPEALGAGLDWDTSPPTIVAPAEWHGPIDDSALQRILCHPRFEAGLEATRRMQQTVSGEPVFAAFLPGPAVLAAQLDSEGVSVPTLQSAGRVTAAMARSCGDAGITLLLLSESGLPAEIAVDSNAWRSSLTTIANVARFFDALPVVIFDNDNGALASAITHHPVPGLFAGCVDAPPGRFPEVHCMSERPGSWKLPPSPCSLVTTAGQVPADEEIAALREACLNLRSEIAGAHGRGEASA